MSRHAIHGVFPTQRVATGRIDELLVRLGTGATETEETLGEYMAAWLPRRRTIIAASTMASYQQMYDFYIRPHLAAVPLTAITVPLLNTWMDELLARGGRDNTPLSAATVQNARAILHKALEDAVLAGLLLLNPVARTQPPRRDLAGRHHRYPPATWTIEELRTFLDVVELRQRLAPLFTLMAMTGMRRSEALGLSWPDIDLDKDEVVIARSLTNSQGTPTLGTSKSVRARRIALGERAVAAVELQQSRQRSAQLAAGKRWTNTHNLVFTRPTGEPMLPESVTDQFRHFVPTLPVRRIRLHDLRHTHAVLLLHAGVPVIDVSHRLGHANPATTLELYAYALENPGHAVAEVFDRLIDDRRWGLSSSR